MGNISFGVKGREQQIGALLQEKYKEAGYSVPEGLQDQINKMAEDQDYVVAVALEDGDIRGFVAAYSEKDVMELEGIFVKPEFRRRTCQNSNISEALMNAVIKKAGDRPILYISKREHDTAIRFFGHYGFEERDRNPINGDRHLIRPVYPSK